MKARWTFALTLAFVACGAPPSTRAPTPIVSHVASPKLEADVVTDRMTYAFRASRAVNLAYQLDCVAGMARCSREAYEAMWKSGWSDPDRAAIETWRSRRVKHIVTPGEAWPVVGAERFEERFEHFWATREGDLASQVAGFARVMNRTDVRALIDGIATFYEPELAPDTRITIELVARPEHPSPNYGQQLGTVSVVEVHPNESADRRLDVVLHESFHFWFASVPKEKRETLLARFIATDSRWAIPAYGLLNEALAAGFGQGLVARLVARDAFDKDMKQVRGVYDDDAVDAIAKAILPLLDATLASHATLYGPDFAEKYLHAVEGALPKLAPRVFLTPMVSLYDGALKKAEFHLYDAVHGGHTESDDDFGEHGLRLLHAHPAWGTVFALRPSTIDSLAAVPDYVDANAMKAIRAARAPFVFTIERKKAGPVFVFVAQDDAEMITLDDAFAALDAIAPGAWRP